MRFLVICRAIEPPPVGYPDQIELLEATQDRFRNGTDTRILDVYSFAGERVFVLLIEAGTARDLANSVFGLPSEPLTNFEIHVLLEPEAPMAASLPG